jgi:hypothetical protein
VLDVVTNTVRIALRAVAVGVLLAADCAEVQNGSFQRGLA